MPGEDGFAGRFLNLFARNVLVAGQRQQVYRAAVAEHLLRQRDRDDDRAFDVAERHGRRFAAHDADDGEVASSNLDDFARRVGFARKEVFLHLRADDADLALVHHVYLVDVTACDDLLRVDLLVVGRVSHHLIVALALFVAAVEFVAPDDA